VTCHLEQARHPRGATLRPSRARLRQRPAARSHPRHRCREKPRALI